MGELPDTAEDVKGRLAEMCMIIHRTVEEMSDAFFAQLRRKVYTTPKSYLDLISLYMKKLEEQRLILHVKKTTLANGVGKLNYTNDQIKIIKVNIERDTPILEDTKEKLKVALVETNAQKEKAEAEEARVNVEKEKVEETAA